MTSKKSFKRRKFLQLSSTAVLAGLTTKFTGAHWKPESSIIGEAAKKVGTFPRIKLGYSQREVSKIIGDGGYPMPIIDAGILCGMNYWHKANRWDEGAPETIIGNRDAHYCQVTVDRVDGNHYEGRFDEEEHYRYVKETLKWTGLRYFDDMQLHFGYHNVAELKNDRSFIRAFERLKKEGLVKHLCLSQHSYAGSPRVEKGEGTAEILTAVVEDGHYEHAQFMYSYDDAPELDEFIEYARTKNFGTIAMKTARGIGRMKKDEAFMDQLPEEVSPHHALARWLTTQSPVDAAVIRVRNLDEFVDTYTGVGKELSAPYQRTMELMTEEANRTTCRLCGKCQADCPQKIPITEILRFERYAMDDHDWDKAMQLYAELPTQGNHCIDCGTCIQTCPLSLRIPEKLSRAHAMLA